MKRHTNVNVFKHMRFNSQYKHPCTKCIYMHMFLFKWQVCRPTLQKSPYFLFGPRDAAEKCSTANLLKTIIPTEQIHLLGCHRKCWWKARISEFYPKYTPFISRLDIRIPECFSLCSWKKLRWWFQPRFQLGNPIGTGSPSSLYRLTLWPSMFLEFGHKNVIR